MGEFRGNQYTENEYADYTYKQLVEDVRSLADELDRSPTTRDARDDETLPCLDRIYDLTDDWNAVLADAGLAETQTERYGPGERSEMLSDLRRVDEEVGGDRLTTREYRRRGQYATSTIKEEFGSWRDACEAANITPGRRYGTSCTGPNGERLDSHHERSVARFLSDRGIDYEVHPTVPGTNWVCDFHLPGEDLWIEVDGFVTGDRPNADSFERKLSHYDENGMSHLVVENGKDLEEKLLEQGALSQA